MTERREGLDERVLAELDDVWQTFAEINPRQVGSRTLKGRLASLCARRLAVSRVSDANGKVEYAITEAGDRALGRT
jgi:DNA-binding PadR family transcriptional regulator